MASLFFSGNFVSMQMKTNGCYFTGCSFMFNSYIDNLINLDRSFIWLIFSVPNCRGDFEFWKYTLCLAMYMIVDKMELTFRYQLFNKIMATKLGWLRLEWNWCKFKKLWIVWVCRFRCHYLDTQRKQTNCFDIYDKKFKRNVVKQLYDYNSANFVVYAYFLLNHCIRQFHMRSHYTHFWRIVWNSSDKVIFQRSRVLV